MNKTKKDKSDISVLVIERNINPSGVGIATEHDIISVIDFLNYERYKIDLVWTISDYKFDDFDVFKRDIEVQEVDSKYIDYYKFLRKKPINSIGDLTDYNFIIVHPEIEDGEKLIKFIKKYPKIPIICPDHNLGIGKPKYLRDEIPIKNVMRDEDGVYIIDDEFFQDRIIELIEYLFKK